MCAWCVRGGCFCVNVCEYNKSIARRVCVDADWNIESCGGGGVGVVRSLLVS